MSKKCFVLLNKAGVRELLRSDEAENVCKEFADKAANKLGDGYVVTTYKGKKRANASVKADTKATQKDALENNTILKAVLSSK